MLSSGNNFRDKVTDNSETSNNQEVKSPEKKKDSPQSEGNIDDFSEQIAGARKDEDTGKVTLFNTLSEALGIATPGAAARVRHHFVDALGCRNRG